MSKHFSPSQRFYAVALVVLLVLGIAGVWRVWGDTIMGMTLRSNDALEQGLVAHYTFDGDSITSVADFATWYDTNYTHRRKVTVESGQVGTTTTSFAIAATTTQNGFKHTSAGGYVRTNDGRDIIMVDATHTTLLDYYQERYSSSTGAVTYWVRTEVNASTDKDFYVYYGYAGASDISNKTGVWSGSSAHVVYDMNENPAIDNCSTYEICDASGNNRHGSTTATWVSGDSVTGRIGQALQFNGTTHKIESIAFNVGAINHQSMMYWAKHDAASPGWEEVMYKANSIMELYIDSNNKFHAYMGNGGSWHSSAVVATAAPTDYNLWHHYAGVYNGSNVRLYRDGVEVASTSETGNFNSSNDKLQLGTPTDGREFAGALDDVRMYDNALTAGDITTIHNNTRNNSTFLTWGPEEAQAKTYTVTNRVGSPNATLYTASSSTEPAFVPGSLGQGMSFNGTTDYASSTASLGSVQTVAFWVYLATTTASQRLINLTSSQRIETNSSGNVVCTSCTGATIYVDGSTASANIPRTGEWHHVTVTFSSLTANNFQMGRAGGVLMGGSLDDVRAYSRALSAAEVTRLYGLGATTRVGVSLDGGNKEGMLAWWTFDGPDRTGAAGTAPWYDSTYAYRRKITAVPSFVATTSSGFQLVATTTIADLKYTSHGGKVQSTTGVDIIFVNADNDAVVPYYQETYSSSTGAITYWLKMAVSSTTDSDVYMYYGKSGAADQSSESGVWTGNGIKHVWDMSENPSTTNCSTYEVCDSTSNAMHMDTDAAMAANDSVTGQVGRAITFNGTTENLRSASTSNPSNTLITAMAWVRNNASSPTKSGILRKAQGSNYEFELMVNNSVADTWLQTYVFKGGAFYRMLNDTAMVSGWNTWHHVAFTYDSGASRAYMYRDGSQTTSSTTFSGALDDTGDRPFWIALTSDGFRWAGQLDDIRVYTYALSYADMLTIYNNTSDNSSFFQWSAEESLANRNVVSFTDMSGNNQTATSSTVELTQGSIGQAGLYNGIYASVASPSLGSGLKTIAFWVRFATTTASQAIIQLDSTARIETNSSRNIVCTNCTSPTIYVNGSTASANIPRTGEWYHVAVTVSAGVAGTTFRMGYAPSGSQYLGGALDDVRVYSRVLSQDEITRLYGLGATTRVGVSAPTAANDSGLVAWWTMDGRSVDLSQNTAELRDSSGNARHADWRNHATTTTQGVSGQAILFDGINDLATTTASLGSVQTVTFWVRFSTTTASQAITNLVGTTRIETNSSGDVVCTGCTGPTIYVNGSTASANIPRTGEWYHVAVTFTALTASGFELGRANGGSIYFGGALDDVRVYSRALTATEILRLYGLAR